MKTIKNIAIATLILFAASVDAEPNRRRPNGRGTPSRVASAGYTTPPVLDPAQFPGVRYWFAPWINEASWQESGSDATELTHVTADAQSFGAYYDPVFGTPTWSPSTARRGVSGTAGGRAYYECSSTGSNDQLILQYSLDLFRSFQDSRAGTIALRIWPIAADGTSMVVLQNNAQTAAQRGIAIERTTGNRINALLTNGTVAACNHTTATTTVLAGEWSNVTIRYDGAGGVEITVDGTEETFTCSGAASAGSAGQLFSFCGRNTGTASMRIGELVVSDTRWSDAQVAAWEALTTARTTEPIAFIPATGGWPYLYAWYDFRNASQLWQNTSGATPVTTAGQSIALVRDYRDPLGYLGRHSTATLATPPTYQGATDGAAFPGNTTQTLAWANALPRGGARTHFVVADCDDLVLGCHLSVGTGEYLVATAGAYSGNNAPGQAYLLHHINGGTTIGTVAGTLINTPDGRNCFVWTRDGSAWEIGTVGGVISTDTDTGLSRSSNLGAEANVGWSMYGYVRGVRHYMTRVPQAQRISICTEMGL